MRCYSRVNISPDGQAYTHCYARLDDNGRCAQHGQQVGKPDWMSIDQWQSHLQHLQGQTVYLRGRGCVTGPRDGGTPNGDITSGK